MSVSTIDNSVRKTHEWLKELREIGGFEDESQAYSALRASLHALRDRLTPGEAADLGSELPMVIRGLYFEGWKPTGEQRKERTLEEFVSHVRDRMRGGTALDPESAAKATFQLLDRRISDGEIRDVRSMLPAKIRDELWPRSETEAAKGR